MDPIHLRLKYVRSTKGLSRYEEAGDHPIIGVLYLAKACLGEKPPACVEVTIGGSDATD